MEEENGCTHDALGTNQEFLTQGDFADNPLNTREYPSSAATNEQNITSTTQTANTDTGTGTGTIPQFPSITNSIPGLRTSSGQHPVVEQVKCSFCKELGHRMPTCPFLPCNLCAIMGHLGKDCPNKKGINWAEREKQCSFCKGAGHQRNECPSRPCRYCAVMGHVGKNCAVIAEKRAERRRKAKAWREAQGWEGLWKRGGQDRNLG